VLLELFKKFNDLWLVEYLFDDLWWWNDFNWNYRRLPNSVLTWGSLLCDQISCRQYDQYESGMVPYRCWASPPQSTHQHSLQDNSPMWDCPGADRNNYGGNCSLIFDPALRLLLIQDVGATAIYISDCEALAQLAIILGRPEMAAELLRRSELMAVLLKQLWKDDLKAWSNKLTNDMWYSRMSPTTFYPLISRAVASSKQASSIVQAWLTNSSRFCIDISGNWPTNSQNDEACWWGLPSISFDDQSYYTGYWRGTLNNRSEGLGKLLMK